MGKRTAEFIFVGDAKSVIRAAKQTEDAITKTEAATKRADEATKKSVAATEKAHKSMRVSYAETAKSAAKFAATSVGIYGVGAALGKVASQTIAFDKSMRNVNSLAQLSETRLKALSDQVLKLAGKTAQAPDTLAQGLYDLVSSGFNAKESMTILASSAKAATAGLTTTEISTKAVAAVLNAYHKPASAAAAVSDTLFQTVNKGVISFEQLSSTIGDVLPFASQLGINLKAVGAAASTLTKAGISPEETMTRLKNVMVTLLKPGKALQATFDDLGVAGGAELIKKFGGGTQGLLHGLDALVNTTGGAKDLEKAYKSLGVTTDAELVKKTGSAKNANVALAGALRTNGAGVAALFPNIRSLGGALALTGRNAKSAEDDLKAFKDVTGATDKALSQQSKSTAYQWNKVKAVFAGLAITAGSQVLPQVNKALGAVGKFATQMQNGTGQGGRFADKLKEIWGEVKPVVTWVGRATKNVAEFVAEHDNVRKLAEAVVGVGAAVKTLKFVSAKSGFTDLLKVGRSVMRRMVAMFATEGAAAGLAAGEGAAGAEGLASGKVNTLIRATGGRSGRLFGKAFGAGAIVGLGLTAKELTDQFYKAVGAKKGTATGFGQALFNTITGKADGGLIPGAGRGDTVPAMLEPGEFVIRRKIVEKYGPTYFAGLNGGMGAGGQRFAEGGVVSAFKGAIGATHAGPKASLALWEAGIVESGLRNLTYGDRDSLGALQLRAGIHGRALAMDPRGSAMAFLTRGFWGKGGAIGLASRNPSQSAGWIAQQVQGSGYPDRYDQVRGQAQGYLSRADSTSGGSTSGGGSGSTPKEALQAHVNANLDKLATLRNRLSGIPTGKAHAGARKALQAQISGLVSSNRSLRTDIRHAPSSADRTASQERSGSRLVNTIMAPFAKGISAATKGAAALGASIDDQGTTYGQADRLFGQTDEDLGTPAGRTRRVKELTALAIMKKKTLDDQRKRAALLKRAISRTQAELKKLRAARDKQHGPKRAKMSERITPVVSRLDDLRAELHSLTGEIVDTQLDIGDLAKEAKEAAGTPDTEVEPGPTAGERTDDLVSLIDARERAGVIDSATAAAQRTQVRQAVLGGALGPLTERERLQIMGDLKEATEQAAQDMSELRQAVIDLKASIDQQNAISGSIVGIQLAEAQRVIGDMFSSQLGTRVANRGMMPGSGPLARL